MAKTVTGIAIAIIEDEIIEAEKIFEEYRATNNWESARAQNYAMQHLKAIRDKILEKKQYKRKPKRIMTNEIKKEISDMNIWQKFLIYWDFKVTQICLDCERKTPFNYYSQTFEEFCNGKFDEKHQMSIAGWYWKFKNRIDIQKHK